MSCRAPNAPSSSCKSTRLKCSAKVHSSWKSLVNCSKVLRTASVKASCFGAFSSFSWHFTISSFSSSTSCATESANEWAYIAPNFTTNQPKTSSCTVKAGHSYSSYVFIRDLACPVWRHQQHGSEVLPFARSVQLEIHGPHPLCFQGQQSICHDEKSNETPPIQWQILEHLKRWIMHFDIR